MTFHHRFLKVPVEVTAFFCVLADMYDGFTSRVYHSKALCLNFLFDIIVEVLAASFELLRLKGFFFSFQFFWNKLSVFWEEGLLERV